MFALMLALSVSADPVTTFTVTNKCETQFVVINKTKTVSPVVIQSSQFKSITGGCGCSASGNCGAGFCKANGGTGCPQSCPIKGVGVTSPQPQMLSLPQSANGGCVGGNCPTSSSPRGSGWYPGKLLGR